MIGAATVFAMKEKMVPGYFDEAGQFRSIAVNPDEPVRGGLQVVFQHDYQHETGEWGWLPNEPCRHCGVVGKVYFMADDGPEGRGEGLQPVRCDACKRSWQA